MLSWLTVLQSMTQQCACVLIKSFLRALVRQLLKLILTNCLHAESAASTIVSLRTLKQEEVDV